MAHDEHMTGADIIVWRGTLPDEPTGEQFIRTLDGRLWRVVAYPPSYRATGDVHGVMFGGRVWRC